MSNDVPSNKLFLISLEQWVQKLHLLVFLEYLSCPSEFSIAPRRIPIAIQA